MRLAQNKFDFGGFWAAAPNRTLKKPKKSWTCHFGTLKDLALDRGDGVVKGTFGVEVSRVLGDRRALLLWHLLVLDSHPTRRSHHSNVVNVQVPQSAAGLPKSYQIVLDQALFLFCVISFSYTFFDMQPVVLNQFPYFGGNMLNSDYSFTTKKVTRHDHQD